MAQATSRGLTYLVYAYGSNFDQLGVSMCSPGGWIGENEVATDLRYLRKEKPIPADRTRILRWNEPGADKQSEQNKQAAEEEHKRYDAATGRICGTLTGSGVKSERWRSIAFLSTQGYSPAEYPQAEVKADGSFCSNDLGPGKYYLYFVWGSEHEATALYYPGVTDLAKATPIEVSAGQTVSNIAFKAEEHSSYSVRGFVSADAKPKFGPDAIGDVTVVLIRTDGDRRVWYNAKANFVFPRLAYFQIEKVVPGHYAACVLVPGVGWMTRKADVNVTSHMKVISLDLVQRKN